MKTIYAIENVLTGEKYIGQTGNMRKREQQHFNSVNRKPDDKRGIHPLYCDMKTYGVENFQMYPLEQCEDENGNEREELYIEHFDSVDNGYNLSRTSYATNDPDVMNKIMTEERRREKAEKFREMNNRNWKDEQYRKERSRFSSELQKERLKDPEYLKKKSDDLKKHWKKKQRQVVQYDMNGVEINRFPSMRQCERETGINVHGHLRNPKLRKQAGGYVFKYLDEVECRD